MATTSSTNSVSIDSINSLIGSTNNNRVSGLASGIDIDSIIAKMMTAASEPLVQMQQNLQLMTWQRDDYRSMNTLLNTLQTSVSNMKLQGSYLTKTVQSSNPAAVTATSGSTAGSASFSLSNITLATSAYNNSASAITSQSNFDPSKSMWDLVHDNALGMTWNTNLIQNEKETVASTGDTFSLQHGYIDINSSINSDTITVTAPDGTTTTDYTVVAPGSPLTGNQVSLDRKTGQLKFSQQLAAGSTISVPDYQYDSINFSLTTTKTDGTANPQSFSFSPSMSLNDILSAISQSPAGVSAFYDSTSKRVSLTRTDTGNLNQTGTGKEIQLSGSFLTSTLKLSESNEKDGVDASYNVNGLPTSYSHSNTITFGGVTANLLQASAGPVTLNVNVDTDTVYKSISDFVDTYNTTIAGINDKISQQRNYDYPPLTDAQKSQMSDTDITAWTAKAQSGMLANDSILGGGLDEMRIDLSNGVSGTSDSELSQLSQIGITTSSNYFDNGKLIISDPAKLRQAISTNPQAVMELFTNTSTDPTKQGIMQRLSSTITNTINQVEQQAGNTNMTDAQYNLGQNIDDLNTQISDFKSRLQDQENSYYNQFTAMESAIQQANSQASFIQGLMA